MKGFHYLLKAMSLIFKVYPETKIITNGYNIIKIRGFLRLKLTSYQEYLLQLIDEYNIYNHIEFKGILSAEEMKEEYL